MSPVITCLITLSLPAASIACSTISIDQRSVGIKPALQFRQPLDPLSQHSLGFFFVDGQPAAFGGIVIGEAEFVRLVDAKAFGDVVELHDQSLSHGKALRQKCRDETRHRVGEIARAAHNMNVGKFRLFLVRKMIEDARAQRLGTLATLQHFDLHDKRAVEYRRPPGFSGKFRHVQSGFLFEFALRAQIEIDAPIHDVVAVGRAAGEINAACLGCLRRP